MPKGAFRPPKKSGQVVLTVVAVVGLGVHADAADPCDPASFNGKACQSAVKQRGYCAGNAWVPMTYQQRYPYYYDTYQQYLSAGGAVASAPVEKCSRPSHGFFAAHGFGSTGRGHHAGG